MTKKAAKVEVEAEVTEAAAPMYDEEPPARFFTGGAPAWEIEEWKAAHCVSGKAYTEGKAADWKDTSGEGSDED